MQATFNKHQQHKKRIYEMLPGILPALLPTCYTCKAVDKQVSISIG